MAKSELRKYFLLLFMIPFSVKGAVITISPQSVDAPIYTRATFTCEGTGDELNWLVQGETLTLTVQQKRDITFTDPSGPGNLSSILNITALPINDGISITCQILSFQPSFQQEVSASTLTVKGISLVEDLQFHFNSLLNVTWSPPVYYSNDIPVGSPISYNVSVILFQNTGDDEGDTIADTTTTNTFIEVDSITECDTFDIIVTAVLAQHTSNYTKQNNGNYFIKEYKRDPIEPTISFKFGCPPEKSLIALMDGNTEIIAYQHTVNESVIEYWLAPFQHYQLTVIVKNLRNKTEATYSTNISTFHTQDINISSSFINGSVNVQCVFVSGSTADGCHVIFTDTTNGRNESFNITGSDNAMISLSTSGYYTVAAYDIINGSFYGPAVQYPTLLSVAIPTVSKVINVASVSHSLSDINTDMFGSVLSVTKTVFFNTVHPTMLSPENNKVQLLAIVSPVIGAVTILIIIITTAVIAAFCAMKKKKNEITEDRIINNPAYGQVSHSSHADHQRSNIITNDNPAYETIITHAINN